MERGLVGPIWYQRTHFLTIQVCQQTSRPPWNPHSVLRSIGNKTGAHLINLMLNQLNAVKGLVVWSVVRDSFSLRESLPKSSMEISGIFDQQVVGFELGCPSNIIQKDALNTLATWSKGQTWRFLQELETVQQHQATKHTWFTSQLNRLWWAKSDWRGCSRTQMQWFANKIKITRTNLGFQIMFQ